MVKLWTTPQTRRIRNTMTTVPTAQRSQLNVFCGREELESFQVIVAPSSAGSIAVWMGMFPNMPANGWLEVAHATFSPTSPWGQGTSYRVTDKLTVVPEGGVVPLSGSEPTVLWFTVYVPRETCGKQSYLTELILAPQGGAEPIVIPVSLYVFDLVLDTEPHLATNGMSQPLFKVTGGTLYTVPQLDAMKQVYGQHRMAGRSQSWPQGLNYQVSWNAQTHTLIDLDNATSPQECVWANGCDYKRYVLGQSGWWKGVPYVAPRNTPVAQSEGFATDGGRPGTFDGNLCNTAATAWGREYSGWMCDAAYENSWKNYMTQLNTVSGPKKLGPFLALTRKLVAHCQCSQLREPAARLLEHYQRAEHLGRLHHRGVPVQGSVVCLLPLFSFDWFELQLAHSVPGTSPIKAMVSREAHPWIYARGDALDCNMDIWVAHINRMQLVRTWNLQVLGSTSWMYFLDQDAGCHNYGGTVGVKCNPYLAPFSSLTGFERYPPPSFAARLICLLSQEERRHESGGHQRRDALSGHSVGAVFHENHWLVILQR